MRRLHPSWYLTQPVRVYTQGRDTTPVRSKPCSGNSDTRSQKRNVTPKDTKPCTVTTTPHPQGSFELGSLGIKKTVLETRDPCTSRESVSRSWRCRHYELEKTQSPGNHLDLFRHQRDTFLRLQVYVWG